MTAEALSFLVAVAVPVVALTALVGLIGASASWSARAMRSSSSAFRGGSAMFWTKRDDRALVDGARVGCPLRGTDVDIERCLACGKLLRVVDDDPPYVVCTAWRTDPRTAELVF